MDRIETYVGQSILEWNFSKPDQNKMVALGKVISTMFGSTAVVNGLACTQQSVATMFVNIAAGEIYQAAQLEATACGTLPADTAHTIMKQGIALDTVVVPNSSTGITAFAAPTTSGQSINYLIEASYADSDVSIDPTTGASPVVLPFYNASTPSSPYQGPNGSGATSNTFRKGIVSLQVKAGTAATTGSQTTPSPDSGYIGLWVVTVAYAQTTITTANITQYAGASILPNGLLQSIISGNLQYGTDSGAANAVRAAFPLPVTVVADGQPFLVKIASTNTGATTFTPNYGAVTASAVVGLGGVALQGGELQAGGYALFIRRNAISSYELRYCSGAPMQVANATASQHAVAAGQIASGSLGTATAGGAANAITAAFPFSPSAYVAGQPFTIVAAAANTGPVTAVLTLGGVAQTSISVTKGAGVALATGDIPGAGYPGEYAYNPTAGTLVMLNPATGVAPQLTPLTASVSSNLITANLAAMPLMFRNATLTTGSGIAINTGALSIAIPNIAASLGATTGVATQLIVLVAYNAGVPVLCFANISGGIDFSETGLISPTTISSSSTSASTIYSASAVAANSPYRVEGYLNATWTSGVGWTLTQVQPCGGMAMAAMQSLGYGQTPQSLTLVSGTTYYNTSAKPIVVDFSVAYSSTGSVTFVKGTSTIISDGNSTGTYHYTQLISPYQSYSVTLTGGASFGLPIATK
jgi:hypothetical protein